MRRSTPLFVIAALAAISLASAPAEACGGTQTAAIIQDAAPDPVPEGVIVLEIAISTPDPSALYGDGLEATVTRTIHGRVAGPDILLRQRGEWTTSCDAPFYNGTAGLMVGIAEGEEGGRTVIAPVLVPKGWMLKETDDGMTLVQVGTRAAEPPKVRSNQAK